MINIIAVKKKILKNNRKKKIKLAGFKTDKYNEKEKYVFIVDSNYQLFKDINILELKKEISSLDKKNLYYNLRNKTIIIGIHNEEKKIELALVLKSSNLNFKIIKYNENLNKLTLNQASLKVNFFNQNDLFEYYRTVFTKKSIHFISTAQETIKKVYLSTGEIEGLYQTNHSIPCEFIATCFLNGKKRTFNLINDFEKYSETECFEIKPEQYSKAFLYLIKDKDFLNEYFSLKVKDRPYIEIKVSLERKICHYSFNNQEQSINVYSYQSLDISKSYEVLCSMKLGSKNQLELIVYSAFSIEEKFLSNNEVKELKTHLEFFQNL